MKYCLEKPIPPVRELSAKGTRPWATQTREIDSWSYRVEFAEDLETDCILDFNMGGFLLAEAGGGYLLVSLNECGPYQDVHSLSQNPAMYQTSEVSTRAWGIGWWCLMGCEMHAKFIWWTGWWNNQYRYDCCQSEASRVAFLISCL